MNANTIFPKRYSDEELAEFKTLLDQKLQRARKDLDFYKEQAQDITDKLSEDSDGWIEDAAMISEVEFLNDLAQRQRKYVRELEQALLRIQNKTYGICVITGELIDKRRLLATPTTTKSLAAKNALQETPAKKNIQPHPGKKTTTPQIITKIITKKPVPPKNPSPEEDDLDDKDDFYKNENLIIDLTLDDIAEKYGYEEEYDFD